jgi:DNA-binding PadR family transcriptional regulator
MSSTVQQIDEVLQSMGFSTGLLSGKMTLRSQSPAQEASTLEGSDEWNLHVTDATSHDPDTSLQAEAEQGSGILKSTSSKRPSIFQQTNRFFPIAPESLADAGLHPNELSDLILKFLAYKGTESGFNIARQTGLKFPIVEVVLRQLKNERLLSYKNSSTGGDYVYELTDGGRERARKLFEFNSYQGTAPVPLGQYINSVKAQSLEGCKPSLEAIRNALSELEIDDRMLSKIGQAVHSGRGMFLYGPAGNGKTSMAERITKAFGDYIWIPRAITASGEIIRLFDPNRHVPAPPSGCDPELIDGRWIQIERPTIVAGGELRMDNLEVTYIRRTGVGEAPLQMKANCGTLLIDDFGRQRMSVDELLNRWIVPLEQRYDCLRLESGRSIQVPFDQLIIFSSNLEPRDLVDEAFLRRIPYKIQVPCPTESQFRALFESLVEKLGFTMEPGVLDDLLDRHYRQANRSLRFCHPRDLLRQIENRCSLHGCSRVINRESLDEAVENYFSIM